MSRRDSQYEIEQKIFLGGQISQKHKEYKLMNQMSPDFAEIYILLEAIPRLEKEDDIMKVAKEIIKIMGQIDATRSWTELTKLSAILGDTRKHYSMKEEK